MDWSAVDGLLGLPVEGVEAGAGSMRTKGGVPAPSGQKSEGRAPSGIQNGEWEEPLLFEAMPDQPAQGTKGVSKRLPLAIERTVGSRETAEPRTREAVLDSLATEPRAGQPFQFGATARAVRETAFPLGERILDGPAGVPAVAEIGAARALAPRSRRAFQLGPLTLRPTITVGASFQETTRAEGLPVVGQSPGRGGGPAGETDAEVRVGVNLPFVLGEPALGRYLAGVYGFDLHTPGRNGGDGGERRSFDQHLAMAGTMEFAKVKFGLGVSFGSLSGPNRDLGGPAERDLLNVALTSSWQLTAKSVLDVDLGTRVREVPGGISSGDLSARAFLFHRYDSKLSFGAGLTAGIEADRTSKGASRVEPSGKTADREQPYVQIAGRAAFQVSPKLALFAEPGVEFRSGQGKVAVNPLFRAGASWTPREGTSITLSGEQRVQGSARLAGQNYLSTGVVLTAEQRLGRRMALLVSLGGEHAVYDGATGAAMTSGSRGAGSRKDNLLTVTGEWRLALSERWSLGVLYAYASNHSSDPTAAFSSSQARVQSSFAF
jgi:hypothetical protein